MIGAPNSLNLNCKVRVMKEVPGPSVSEEIADIFTNYNIDYYKDTKFDSQILATKFGFVPDCLVFAIPHKISCPYIERYDFFYSSLWLDPHHIVPSLHDSWPFNLLTWLNLILPYFLWVFPIYSTACTHWGLNMSPMDGSLYNF